MRCITTVSVRSPAFNRSSPSPSFPSLYVCISDSLSLSLSFCLWLSHFIFFPHIYLSLLPVSVHAFTLACLSFLPSFSLVVSISLFLSFCPFSSLCSLQCASCYGSRSVQPLQLFGKSPNSSYMSLLQTRNPRGGPRPRMVCHPPKMSLRQICCMLRVMRQVRNREAAAAAAAARSVCTSAEKGYKTPKQINQRTRSEKDYLVHHILITS